MSTTQNPAPEAPVTATAPQANPKATRRSRTPREPTAPVDPAVEEMRDHVVANAGAPAAAPEEEFDATAVLTLATLTEQYGPATPEEVDLALEGADLVKLASDGASVSTRRITREGARIWGIISGFRARATPAQRALVPAITDNFMRVAIWSTYHAQELYESRQDVQKDITTLRAGRTINSADLRRRASGHRDVLYAGLLVLAGKKPDLRGRIELVYNKNSQPAQVASSLRALVNLGREVLADTSPGALHRRQGSLIDENYLATGEALANDVAALGEVAEALSARPPVLQEELDLWDGRNLAFIEMAVDAFDAARTLDPSMPRIALISLRNFFGRRSRPAKDEPSTTPPAPPCPTSTPATPPTDARQAS
ncbi:MAG TPA: hypothetical protein VH877_33960 [Polyangia bacterium]|jgi:hypothetical protein|nr:hypothetical protein [Polyangia bacterium]